MFSLDIGNLSAHFRKRSAREWAADQRERFAEELPMSANPKTTPAATEAEVMWDQFEQVMDLGPSDARYQAIRPILMQLFDEKAMGATA